MIDWETAKNYAVEVMEYFGSRLVWKGIDEVVGPNTDDHVADLTVDQSEIPSTSSRSSIASKAPPPAVPNEIEYANSDDDD